MNNLKKKQGFTLVELLVVTGLVLLLSGVIGNVFYTTLKGSTKTTVANEVKQNGDQALAIMEKVIRGSAGVNDPICNTPAKTYIDLSFVDKSDAVRFSCLSNNRIEMRESAPNLYITSDKVSVTNCSFSCFKQPDSSEPITVNINFTISQKSTAGFVRPEEGSTLSYRTSVVIRNSRK